jgi:hypothetical protein
VARIDRIAQRRQLRRAAEQALMTAFHPEPSIDDQRDEDPHEHGHDPDNTPPLGIPLPAAGEIYTTPIDPDAVELSAVPSRRWYYPKRGPIGLIEAAALAIAVTGVLLVVRHGQAGPEKSTTDSPIASTTAAPTPTSAPAPLPTVVPPSPPLSPPPPSAAPSSPAPVITEPYTPPDEDTSTAPDTPEIGVTRTPVTRAPFSASPSPMPPPQYDQGDGRRGPRRGCCGF